LPIGRMYSDKTDKPIDDMVHPIYSEAELTSFMQLNPQCVIGTTVWALRKYATPSTCFDMLVVDEASQLLLSQCLLATQWLLPTGRMVVVGDHFQLPPISNTVFPDASPSIRESTNFAKSVFEYLQVKDREAMERSARSLTMMLNENWRSNAVLNSISSETIYASKDPLRHYHPANDAVSSQKFWLQAKDIETLPNLPTLYNWTSRPELAPIPITHPLLQLMFDANRPFGVVLLKQAEHGVSLDSFPQAKLIACLVSAVRHAASVINTGETDESFWRSKLLVVAPHHAQRHRIRDGLLDTSASWRVGWDPEVSPSIDTVEKAQGRQFTSVIVDYGIIDGYRIAKELDFLYSRNRINVAQTRAESKCLFFVSDIMLQMSPNIYSSKRVQEGFSYLQHIVNWAKLRKLVYEIKTDEIEDHCKLLANDPFFTAISDMKTELAIAQIQRSSSSSSSGHSANSPMLTTSQPASASHVPVQQGKSQASSLSSALASVVIEAPPEPSREAPFSTAPSSSSSPSRNLSSSVSIEHPKPSEHA